MRDPDNTDWEALGFRKSVTWKYLKRLDNGKVKCQEVDFYAADHVCDNCQAPQYTYLRPERVGVYRTCVYCRRTSGPMSKEAGILRKEYDLTVDEAVAIMEARNAHKRDIMAMKKKKPINAPYKKIQRSRERPTEVK